MSRGYFPKVALLGLNNAPLRHVHGEAARAMVNAGIATARHGSGRIREVVLAAPTTACAERIGPPSPPQPSGVRFTRWQHLETTRVIEHHPRCLWVL